MLVAGFFAKQNDWVDFPELGELSVDSLLEVLPAGFVKDARDLAVFLPGNTDGKAGTRG